MPLSEAFIKEATEILQEKKALPYFCLASESAWEELEFLLKSAPLSKDSNIASTLFELRNRRKGVPELERLWDNHKEDLKEIMKTNDLFVRTFGLEENSKRKTGLPGDVILTCCKFRMASLVLQ